MSSGPLPWPLLNSFLPLPTLAGQPSTASLPMALASAIPDCAQSCVESFIADEFPTSVCSIPQDLDCLCTKNSKSGFTLGEGSLRCVVTTCVGVESSEDPLLQNQGREETYAICAGIPNANPMTHGTLTATRSFSRTVSTSSTRTALSPRKSSSSSRRSRTNTLSSRLRTRSSTLVPAPTSDTTSTTVPITRSRGSAASRSVTSQSATFGSSTSSSLSSPLKTTHSSTIAGSSPTSSFPTIPAAPPPAPPLSKGKIAGIAISTSFAALVVAGIIIFFIRRYRRRRSNRRNSDSTFGEDNFFTNPPSSPGLYRRVNGEPEPNYISRESTQLEGQEGQITAIRGNRSSPNLWRNNVQLALTPERTIRPVMAESPMSSKRSRTQSTLLPDKPGYSLYPGPLRFNHSVSPESPGGDVVPGAAGIGQRGAMALSKASPRGLISPDTSQVSPQRDWSDPHPSASDPFLDSRSNPSLAMYGRQRSQNPRLEVLTYGRPNPEVPNQGQWTQSLDNLRKPVPARQSPSARSLTRQKAEKASISPSDHIGRPVFDFPPNSITIPREPVPRKSAPRRSATHYSSASEETTFEDAGDEDAIPRANAILLPVEEPPAMRSNRRQAASPNVSWSLPTPSERRPDPESPTPRSARRKQPPPIVTPATAARTLKSSLKPLPPISEIPDSSTPLIPKRRGHQVSAPVATDSRDSPRGETELTAKWKILIGSGLQPIENSGTPRSGRSSEWTPNTPTRRDA